MRRSTKVLLLSALAALLLAGSALAADQAEAVGVTTGSSLRLRSEPSLQAAVLTHLNKGVDLAVLPGSQDGWYHVCYNGRTGYVSAAYLDLIPDGVFTCYGRVADSGTNLRTQPSETANVAMTLNANEVVNVNGFQGGWYAVSCEDGTAGYIRSDLLYLTDSNASGIVEFAKQFLGTPYVYGGAAPGGFDCSGFTSYVFQQFGYSLPRTASGQWDNVPGTRIYNIWDLQPGDLVFINDPTRNGGKSCSHAAIYAGNGQIIHSSSPRSGGVIISDLTSGYYNTYFAGGIHL